MKGFKDTAAEAGCLVTGGQTVMNPWLTIGNIIYSLKTFRHNIKYVENILK
jgi:hypothetical protein